MPRRMARRGGGGGKIRYAWHGFYMSASVTPADTIADVFVLYDPIDDDHQEEVVLQRIRMNIQVSNPSTGGSARIAFGVYLASGNATRNMTSDIAVLGITQFDIESNWTLYNEIIDMPAAIAGQQNPQFTRNIDIKAKRKISDPQFLVVVIQGDQVSRWKYIFRARALVKEGRF